MIDYRLTFDELRPDDLRGFFEGWPSPPSPELHLRLLRESTKAVIAVDVATNGVVGFATAHSDGILSAYVPLLEVRRSHRGRGIGSELVRRLVEELRGLYMVDLTCDEELQPFYERLGFRPLRAMALRDHEHQSGASRE